MADIKELKEAFVGANEIALFICERLKDGIGVDDATALFGKLVGDEAFKKIIVDAYEGMSKIPEEVKDMSISEGVELGGLALSYVPKYVEVFKKEESA